jgi:Chain length determinant protein
VSEQALDLRSAVAVLRRRKRILIVAAAVGLAAGVTFAILQPPRFTSTTLVLLPPPTVEQTDPGVETQVAIVLSTSILGKAGQQVHPTLSARDLADQVVVSAPTPQLIRIQASSLRAHDAQALSQGIADAYVGYVQEASRQVSSTALAALDGRQSQLEGQVSALQSEIGDTNKRRQDEASNSPNGIKDAQLLAQLRAEQADVSLQLDKIKDEIAAASPAPSTTGSGTTSIVQKATPAVGQSALKSLLLWVPFGALSGALLAAVVLLTLARTDRRARLRDEIADAVGGTVVGVVRSRPQRSVAGWSTLLESYTPGPVDNWAFRQVLRALAPPEERSQARKGDMRVPGRVDHPRSLTVVSLSGDLRGLAVGPQLAAFAASLGITTRLLTAVGNESAAPLWAACAADRDADPRPGLVVGEVRPEEAAELTVVLAVVDRRQPRLGHALRTSATLLTVASGAATEEELARLAVAIDDAGRTIDGIVVADPDRSDRTTGRLSMDERARQVALPVRLTGLRPEGVGDLRRVRS